MIGDEVALDKRQRRWWMPLMPKIADGDSEVLLLRLSPPSPDVNFAHLKLCNMSLFAGLAAHVSLAQRTLTRWVRSGLNDKLGVELFFGGKPEDLGPQKVGCWFGKRVLFSENRFVRIGPNLRP